MPGPLATRDVTALPADYKGSVTLAYPSAPGDLRGESLAALNKLLPARADNRPPHALQVSTYGAAQLLAEGLRRTGRDLSRRKLLAQLEQVQSFETGLMPRLSYNADRRIGAMGAYLVGLDFADKSIKPLGRLREGGVMHKAVPSAAKALIVGLLAGLAMLPALAQQVVARVNGVPIVLEQLDRENENVLKERRLHTARMTDPNKFRVLRQEALDRLVQVELLWQEARAQGLAVSDKDVETSVRMARKDAPQRSRLRAPADALWHDRAAVPRARAQDAVGRPPGRTHHSSAR